MSDSVSVALIQDEILQEQSTIVVDVRDDVDVSLVRDAMGVPGVAGSTTFAGPGRVVWAPQTRLPAGRHHFVVEAIADENLQPISRRIQIAFYVVATRAEFPAVARIESFARVRLTPEGFDGLDPKSIPDGEFVDIVKAVNRDSQRLVSFGFDQDGRPIDAELLLHEHRIRLVAERRKLDHELQKHLAQLPPDDDVLIDAWFSVADPEPIKSDRPHDANEDLTKYRERGRGLVQRVQERAQEIVADLGNDLTPGLVHFLNPDDRAPVLRLRVPGRLVHDVSRHDAIKAIFLHEERVILDLGGSIAVAGSDLVHSAGQTGEAVRVGVWEPAPFLSTSYDAREQYTPPPPPLETHLHSTAVHAIVRNNGSIDPRGHAPSCHLVSANSGLRDALTWAVGKAGCSIINQSFHRPGEADSSTSSSEDHYCDWLAAQEPHPLIVQAAGNLMDEDGIVPPNNEYVNHKSYNTLKVASHDEKRAVAASSTFRNPSSLHGDRELPEISAKGIAVVAEGKEWDGTSFAAPAVAGAAALIQGAAPLLVCWPEGCRAILLASAGPRDSAATWWQNVLDKVDAKDGAGALDAHEAFEVAKSQSSRGAAATSRGWDVGLLEHANLNPIGETVFSYRVSIPDDGEDVVAVQVALAWRVRTGDQPDYWSYLSADLDLCVYDAQGIRVAFSGSWDNNYEVAQFNGIRGATYDIRIRMVPPGESTWYGIAWTARA
jgi:hypothetical protein